MLREVRTEANLLLELFQGSDGMLDRGLSVDSVTIVEDIARQQGK
jgi:hypothetical protein